MINIAILGFGVVGSGVLEIINEHADDLIGKTGDKLNVKYILDLRDFSGHPMAEKFTKNYDEILNDPEVLVVAEVIGGTDPAYTYTKRALEAGKHVVTSNKALVAAYGTELLAIAREKNVNFFFEASVGGGIPIIRPLYRCLKGEKILEITGILNGTTNFILTKMDKEGASFETVLKEAQDLGYAERNPEADVEGYDTCRKIAILTAMATGKEVNYEDICTEGITKITDVDFKYADKLGTSVKLFGTSRMDGNEVHAWVAPVMIGKDHPLYAVNDVFNGILVKGNMLGTSMFYGSGAGKLPTASAVIADIMEAVENTDHNVPFGWSGERLTIADQKTSVHRYFVRVEGNGAELEQAAATAFGGGQIVKLENLTDEFALLTGEMSEAAYADCAAAFEKTAKIRQRIRAEF